MPYIYLHIYNHDKGKFIWEMVFRKNVYHDNGEVMFSREFNLHIYQTENDVR